MKIEQSPIWQRTVSGKIYSFIQKNIATPDTNIQIINAGELIETIIFNGDEAHIRKQVRGDLDSINTSIESYEYKRLDWWRKTIDAQSNMQITLLDPPLMWVAKDAKIENWEGIFKPTQVMKQQGIYTGNDRNKIAQAQTLIRSNIIECYDTKLGPHYSLNNSDGALRLIAETPEAIESRTEDNDTYHSILGLLHEGVPQLLESYKNIQV